jgi:hypothetical protein
MIGGIGPLAGASATVMSTTHTESDAAYIAASVRAALEYHERRGWAVIDLPFKTKSPSDRTRWQDERLDAAALRQRFTATPRNLGGLLGVVSRSLSDQDFDCHEAAVAAPYFYPDTELVSGRLGHPHSHRWHVISDSANAKPCKWIDPVLKKTDGKPLTLVELRFTGQQTVLPPSIHPSGEPYRWEQYGEPGRATFAELVRAGRRTAACAMLALRWNRLTTSRHEGFLALAGGLLRGGWTAEDATTFCVALAAAAGMDPDRMRELPRHVASTAKRIAANEPATGFPALEAALPDWSAKAGLLLRKWLDVREAAHETTGSATDAPTEEDDPEPIDIFGDPLLTGTPTFPIEAIPAPIADYARDLAARLGVDPALPAMAGLAVCAAAIDDRHQVQPKAHDRAWRESPRLWIATIAESGELKTPLLDAMVKPLRAIEARWWKDDAAERARYERDYQRYRARLKAWEKHPDNTPEPEPPERPPLRRRLLTDFTVEAAADVLVDNPSGALIYADELSGLVGRFDAYGSVSGKDQSAVLETYNGGPRLIDRVKRGATLVPNWSLSILGGIQPAVIAKLAPRLTDDGFLARFLLFFPIPTTFGADQVPAAGVTEAYADTLAGLLTLPFPAADAVYTLAPEAPALREGLDRLLADVALLSTGAPGLAAALRKWSGLFARLALTFHLVASVGKHEVPPAPVVPLATLLGVLELLTDYCLPHATRFYSEVCQQMPNRHARWIAGHILAAEPPRLSMRDIGRVYHELRSDGAAIGRAMEILHLASWVSPIDVNGKAPTRWRVNPRVHAAFAARAAEERERRKARVDAIRAAADRLRRARGAST